MKLRVCAVAGCYEATFKTWNLGEAMGWRASLTLLMVSGSSTALAYLGLLHNSVHGGLL